MTRVGRALASACRRMSTAFSRAAAAMESGRGDDSDVLPTGHPVVVVSDEARSMLAHPNRSPVAKEAPEEPLPGSAADRMRRARGG